MSDTRPPHLVPTKISKIPKFQFFFQNFQNFQKNWRLFVHWSWHRLLSESCANFFFLVQWRLRGSPQKDLAESENPKNLKNPKKKSLKNQFFPQKAKKKSEKLEFS